MKLFWSIHSTSHINSSLKKRHISIEIIQEGITFCQIKTKNSKWVKKFFLHIYTMSNLTVNEMRMLAKLRNIDSYDNVSKTTRRLFYCGLHPPEALKNLYLLQDWKTCTCYKIYKNLHPPPISKNIFLL